MKRSIHYFSALNVFPKFNINKAALKKNYYNLSKMYHPDRMQIKNDDQSIINESYKVLNDDLSRYSYLANSLSKKYNIIFDIPKSSFLEHVMNLYEREDFTNLSYEYTNNLNKLKIKTQEYDNTQELKLLEDIGCLLHKVNILKRYNET
jgi:DnaJ-class molecular chaperone